MQIKCASCETFVPVEESAFRYCANCGASTMSHPVIGNVQEQIRQTITAQGQLTSAQGRSFFLVIGFIFIGLPFFPPGSQLWLFIGTFILASIVGRSFKQRLLKKYPSVFTNEHWKP